MWLLSHTYIFSLFFTLYICIFICSTNLLKAPKEVVNTDFDFIYKKIEKNKKKSIIIITFLYICTFFILYICIFICSTSLLKVQKEVVNTDFDFIYKKIEKIKKINFS